MILEISTIQTILDGFYHSDTRIGLIGGIVGTQINKFVLDASAATTPFNSTLIINGCYDYIGLMDKTMPNVIHWTNAVVSRPIESFNEKSLDVWDCKYDKNERYETRYAINELVNQFSNIIVLEAQCIPRQVINILAKETTGRIMFVTDPYEDNWITQGTLDLEDYPILVDTLSNLSANHALARSLVGFDTRSIDRGVKCSFKEIKSIRKNSFGKIDDCQYVTNNCDILCENDLKFINMDAYKKNMKVMISDNRVYATPTFINGRQIVLGPDMFLIAKDLNHKPFQKWQLFNSNHIVDVSISPDRGRLTILREPGTIAVHPANIITPRDVKFHRFNNIVVLAEYKLRAETQYSLLKNATNVTMIEKFN